MRNPDPTADAPARRLRLATGGVTALLWTAGTAITLPFWPEALLVGVLLGAGELLGAVSRRERLELPASMAGLAWSERFALDREACSGPLRDDAGWVAWALAHVAWRRQGVWHDQRLEVVLPSSLVLVTTVVLLQLLSPTRWAVAPVVVALGITALRPLLMARRLDRRRQRLLAVAVVLGVDELAWTA